MTKCSICKVEGHRSTDCNGVFITEWTEKLKRYWMFGYHNSVENDEEVKLWAQNYRFTMPIINRLFEKLRNCARVNGWFRIYTTYRDQYAEMKFIMNIPGTILICRAHIGGYVRPTERQIDINAIIAAQDRERAEIYRVRREVQEREEILDRQRIAADPNILVRRNLQNEFNRANDALQHAQANAIRHLSSHNKRSIQYQMDTTEQAYFVNDDCPICMEPLTPGDTIAIDCRHTFCVKCLKRVIPGVYNTIHNCPCCRCPITKIRFKPTITPDNFNTISTYLHNL